MPRNPFESGVSMRGESEEGGIEQREQLPTIKEFAKKTHRDGLLGYIDSAAKANENIGLNPDKMFFNEAQRTMTLTVSLDKERHQGWENMMQGGVPRFFIDTNSGALVFAVARSDQGPAHDEYHGKNHGAIVFDGSPITVVSSFAEEPDLEVKRPRVSIKTEVFQRGKLCVSMVDEIDVVPAGALKRRIESQIRANQLRDSEE